MDIVDNTDENDEVEIKNEDISLSAIKLETQIEDQKIENDSIPTDVNLSHAIDIKNEFNTDVDKLPKNEIVFEECVLKTKDFKSNEEKINIEQVIVCSKKYDNEAKVSSQNNTVITSQSEIKKPSKHMLKKCPSCDFETAHKETLKRHALIHIESKDLKMYKCQKCHFETQYRWNFEQHFLLAHEKSSKAEIFKCAHCDFGTKLKSYLKKHIFFVHKTDQLKNLKCNICDFQAQNKWKFKRHLLKHTEPHLKCDQCSFKTRYEHCLTYHMTNLHKKNTN